MYNTIKKYYMLEKYTNEQMKVFVGAGWITAIEYKEITGVDFVA